MKRIVYVFDDINYRSGAQSASLYQMECLAKWYDISVLSLSRPESDVCVPGKLIAINEIWENADVYTKSFRDVMAGHYPWLQKIRRLIYTISMRLGVGERFLERFLYRTVKEELEQFDVVFVVSEASKLRELVAKLVNPNKIQWIHTDYALWSQYSTWTKAVTKNDAELYSKYDSVVVLSQKSGQGMLDMMPHLAEKIKVIPNLINVAYIQKKASEPCEIVVKEKQYKFITVGRLDKEKNFDRVLSVCKSLAEEHINFIWYLAGDGPLKEYIEDRINDMELGNHVIMTGRLENPYPLMKKCDIFVLLSDYEGTPVTIDEAVVLGLHVIATPVGGIPEQLERYGCGYVLDNLSDSKLIYEEFKQGMNEKCINWVLIKEINEKILENIEGMLNY